MWGLIAGAALGAGASLLGGKKANEANSALSARQMDFQEYMSNTAHRREVEDLRAAGLNPILSGTGGAGSSTPAGSTATAQNIGQGVDSAINTGLAVRRQKQELSVMKSQEDKNNQDRYLSSRVENIRQLEEGITQQTLAAAKLDLEVRKAAQKGLLDQAKMESSSAYKAKRHIDATSETLGGLVRNIFSGARLNAGTSARGASIYKYRPGGRITGAPLAP